MARNIRFSGVPSILSRGVFRVTSDKGFPKWLDLRVQLNSLPRKLYPRLGALLDNDFE
jgi:hypothetical protein